MSARGRVLSGLVTIVVALAGFLGLGALPAAASPPTIQYVALGDSYAAGTAAGSFPNCQQSTNGYPALLDSEKSIHLRANATCSGATTSSVATTQLSALNRGTRLVTVTVGAANLGLSGVLAVCSDPTRTLDCLAAIQNVRDVLLPALGSDLTDLYAEVGVAAPKALILVTGYPHLFASAPPPPYDPVVAAAVNSAIDQLNQTIEDAVDAQPASVHIVYVGVTGVFGEHGIGGELPPFINPPGTADAFHPNAAGYVAYAAAISAALPAAWLAEQTRMA